MTPLEFIYQYAALSLEAEQRVILCAKLLCVDIDTLRAWLARREEHSA
ncbi:MAG: hypothetical protein JZU60_02050 [Ilumatobacteraceae bacterium]|jgi:hypothetical protein|nr:hypothetical protein [Ilumatobacteraceae bacterium]